MSMSEGNPKGKFIVFEGLDGSGQSTQVGLLSDYLEKKGFQVLKTKEPTKESDAGKKIAAILSKKERVSAKELQELFVEDRRWHLDNVIIPNLEQGNIVISDRYFFSTLSFGAAEGLDTEYLWQMNKNFLFPDIVFFLDATAETCVKRIEGRGEEKKLFERKEKLGEVYRNYKKVFQRFESTGKIYYINGEKGINEVFGDVKIIINNQL